MSNLIERHQKIVDKISNESTVLVADLCKELDVSSVTIRKDLKFLEEKQLLYRTHGGATQSNPYAMDRHINEKEFLHVAEKNRIGECAAGLLVDNDCILIASGTTVLFFSRHIKPHKNLTVITASLNVALEIVHHPGIEVIQLGGLVRKTSTSVTGLYAEHALLDFSCTMLFLGVDGIDLDFGITTTNMMEAQINKRMMGTAQKTIVLADSSKFGKRGFGKICALEEVDQVITDTNLSPHITEKMRAMGIEVTLV